ncbi:hypothetical protein KFE25_011604 [Diacronema lutheri]|uniref:Uncharacterized protein n=1 Tax=Diacronema lutheri TaxID=2081491 RepID=A0A8J5XKE7_DIALT|nr:hypothetical protein KFE25_011604 [Diacronema lutheri]
MEPAVGRAARPSALKPLSSNEQHARAAPRAAAGSATRIPKPSKPRADAPEPEAAERPCETCERSDAVLREAQNTVREQEEELKFLTDKAEELCVALTNAQEEAAQFQAEAERIQSEGEELYRSYTAKCGKVVQLSAQHAQLTSALADRDARLLELERAHVGERAALSERIALLEQRAPSAGAAEGAQGTGAKAGEARQAHLREAAELANELLRDELRQMGAECDRLRAELDAAGASAVAAAGVRGAAADSADAADASEPDAAARAELSRARCELTAAHKEAAALQRELAGAMVSNERLQDDLRLLRKSRARESLAQAPFAPVRAAALPRVDAGTSTQPELADATVQLLASPAVRQPPPHDGVVSCDARDERVCGRAPAADHASADLIAALEAELDEERAAVRAAEARAAEADARAADAEARAAKAVAARAESNVGMAEAAADGAATSEKSADAAAAREAEHAARNAEQQSQLARAAEHLAAAHAREAAARAECAHACADAGASRREAAEARAAGEAAEHGAARALAQLDELRAELAAALKAQACAADAAEAAAARARAAEARAGAHDVSSCVAALCAEVEARALTADAQTLRAQLDAARADGRAVATRLGAELGRWRAQAEELAEYAALEAETASLSLEEARAVDAALCSAKAAVVELSALELDTSDLAIHAADLLEHLGAAERGSNLRCSQLEAMLAAAVDEARTTLAAAHERADALGRDLESARADADDERARARDATDALGAESARGEAERAAAERAHAEAVARASALEAELGARLEASAALLAAEGARAAERASAAALGLDAARAAVAAAREAAEADARTMRAQAIVREMALGDTLAAADEDIAEARAECAHAAQRAAALQAALAAGASAHERQFTELRETHASERRALELRMRARASTFSSAIASVGQPGIATRVLAIGTPTALVSAAGGGLDGHRGNDMCAMRSALSDAKRRLAQQRERMREHGMLSP